MRKIRQNSIKTKKGCICKVWLSMVYKSKINITNMEWNSVYIKSTFISVYVYSLSCNGHPPFNGNDNQGEWTTEYWGRLGEGHGNTWVSYHQQGGNGFCKQII